MIMLLFKNSSGDIIMNAQFFGMIVVKCNLIRQLIDCGVQVMSIRRASTIRNSRAYYYIYLNNLPDKYLVSNIFPEIILSQDIKDDIIEQEIKICDSFCLFGFKTKQISCKFQKQMKKLMPPFVIISRRQVEISRQLKEQKRYYDSHNTFSIRSFDWNESVDSSFNRTVDRNIMKSQNSQQSSLFNSSQSSYLSNIDSTKLSINNEQAENKETGFFEALSKNCSSFISSCNFFESLWKK